MSQKQKTEKREKERKKERLNDGNNNGQLCIATPPRVAHAKLPGPKDILCRDMVSGFMERSKP